MKPWGSTQHWWEHSPEPALPQPSLACRALCQLFWPCLPEDTALLSYPPASHSKLQLAWRQETASTHCAAAQQKPHRARRGTEQPSNQVQHTLSILLSVLLNILGAYHTTKYSRTCSTGRKELDVRSRITTDRFPDNSGKYYRFLLDLFCCISLRLLQAEVQLIFRLLLWHKI